MSEVQIDPKMLKALLDAFEKSDWEEMTLSVPGGDALHLSRNPDSPDFPLSTPQAPAAPPASAESPPPASSISPQGPSASGDSGSPEAEVAPLPVEPAAAGVPVPSTTVGIFWVAPSPGEPPFVAVGDRIGAGDTIGIVEVMKLMNHVPAGLDGVVTAVLVGNGEPVEFGQALVMVDPEA